MQIGELLILVLWTADLSHFPDCGRKRITYYYYMHVIMPLTYQHTYQSWSGLMWVIWHISKVWSCFWCSWGFFLMVVWCVVQPIFAISDLVSKIKELHPSSPCAWCFSQDQLKASKWKHCMFSSLIVVLRLLLFSLSPWYCLCSLLMVISLFAVLISFRKFLGYSWVQDQHWEQLAQRERVTQISPD